MDERTTNKRRREAAAAAAAAGDDDDDDADDDVGDNTQVTQARIAAAPPDSLGDITKSELIIGPGVSEYDLGPGAMLGEYRIEGKAGEGGMGVVYAAVHPMIGKRAAIKVLKKEYCEDPYTVERFIDEARVVNAIGHPNIVDIFAFGEMPNGRSYFVMEWLPGKSLRERLAERRLSLVEVCAILKPLARALQAAHDKGIIHRDLKPDNVLLGEADEDAAIPVKLLDFGIAKLTNKEGGIPRLERTSTGTMVGTPMYIAPEQARGHAIDHRADIYSLGAIAFEMITGRTPFLADNAMEMVAKHLLEAPPTVRSVAPNTPPALDRVVSAMIQKEPAARPTLASLLSVLEGVRGIGATMPGRGSTAAAETESTALEPAGPARRGNARRWAAVAGVAVLVAIAAFAITKAASSSSGRSVKSPPPPPPVIEEPAPPTPPPAAPAIVLPPPVDAPPAPVDASPPPPPPVDAPPPPRKPVDAPPHVRTIAPPPTPPVVKTVKHPPVAKPHVDDNTLMEPGSLKP